MRWFTWPALIASLFTAGCDGLFSGDSVARFPLTARNGGYAPLRLTLGPDMNPMALNLHAQTAANAAEAGKWNSYRATLTRNGATVATALFHMNNTGTADNPQSQSLSRTMLVVDVAETGDYDLDITGTAPQAVTLEQPHLELRRNVRRPKAR
jgi:hypothetical protein